MANTVVEAFGGVHDWMNDKFGFSYGSTGLASQTSGWWSEFMNYANIALAAPMGINNMVTPAFQPWLQNYYDHLSGKK